jgi:putative transposase
MVLLGWS